MFEVRCNVTYYNKMVEHYVLKCIFGQFPKNVNKKNT